MKVPLAVELYVSSKTVQVKNETNLDNLVIICY